MKLKNKLIQFYGNRGFVFDLFLTIILVGLLSFSKGYIFSYNETFVSSLIGLLGVLAGFMLTAFSLLLLYNPKQEENPKLAILRKSNAFKNALKYFIKTILIILTTIFVLFLKTIYMGYSSESIILFVIILPFLMLTRCLYYLFAIIDF